MTTGQTEKKRGGKRRRKRRKDGRATEINNLLKSGSLREGECDLMTAQHKKIYW